MLAAPRQNIEKIARHIGLDPSSGFLDQVVEATSFNNMQSQPERFTPYADMGYWHDPKAFFHSAGTRQWKGQVNEEVLELYRQAMAKALPPKAIAWIEHGSMGS